MLHVRGGTGRLSSFLEAGLQSFFLKAVFLTIGDTVITKASRYGKFRGKTFVEMEGDIILVCDTAAIA